MYRIGRLGNTILNITFIYFEIKITPGFKFYIGTFHSLEKTLILVKIEGRRRRGQQRMRWLDGIIDSMDEFEHTLGNGEGQGNLMCYSPRGNK